MSAWWEGSFGLRLDVNTMSVNLENIIFTTYKEPIECVHSKVAILLIWFLVGYLISLIMIIRIF